MEVKARRGPSIVDLTFFIWAVGIPLAFSGRLVNSDGDLARHITMGEYMLRHGRITRDVFSFTKAGEPFLAYEWLSEICLALFHRLGGVAGVAIGAGLLLAAAYALIVLFMRGRGVDPLLAYLIGILAALLGAVHWLARPHLFTLLGLAVLLFLLETRDRRALWAFAPLFALWANLHPGFVVGIIILGVYLAGDLAEAWVARDRTEWLRRARYHGSAIAIGLAASLLNPHGVALHLHIRALLGNKYLMDTTNEFMSPSFHGVHGKLFLLTLVAIIAGLTLRRSRVAFPRLFLLLFTLASALIAQRNIPLFGLLTLPVLALEFDAGWRRFSLRGLNHVRGVFQTGEAVGRPGLLFAPITLAMLLLAWQHGAVAGLRLVQDEFDRAAFPVDAVAHASAASLRGRMFHPQTWGGYVLYAWPRQTIFIDGLTDFFGEELARSYVKVINLEAGWDLELRRHGITLALLPPQSRLAYALDREGWERLYGDDTAVLLRQRYAGDTE